MTKEQELMNFLRDRVFGPVLEDPDAPKSIKNGVRWTINRMSTRDAEGMRHYFWSAIIGTEQSVNFARLMKKYGFTRFEEVLEEFRDRFNDKWLYN